MALKDEISRETVKLKDMPPKKKAEYIWEYYKFHILGTIAAIILIFTFVRDYRENNKPLYLSMVVINSDLAYSDENCILNDFVAYAGIDTGIYNVDIDTGFVISESGMDQMSLANTEKLMAMFAAGNMDLLLGPDNMIDEYGAMSAYKNIEEILTPGMREQLENNGYELYYTTVYEEDDSGKLVKGDTYLAGVYLDKSEYLNRAGGTGAFTSQKEAGRRPVLAFAHSVKNTEHAIKMLEMLTGG